MVLQLGVLNVEELCVWCVVLVCQCVLLQVQQVYQLLFMQNDVVVVVQVWVVVELVLDVVLYWLLLIIVQLQQGQLVDVECSVDQVLQVDGGDFNVWLMCGYLCQCQGKILLVNEDFDFVLVVLGLIMQQCNVCLLVVDVVLVVGDCICVVVLLVLLQVVLFMDVGDVCVQQLLQQGIEQCVRVIGFSCEFLCMSVQVYLVLFQYCQFVDIGGVCMLMLVDLQGDGGVVQCVYVVYVWQDYVEVIGEVWQVVQFVLEDVSLQGLLIIMLVVGNCSQQDEVWQCLEVVLVQYFDDVVVLM